MYIEDFKKSVVIRLLVLPCIILILLSGIIVYYFTVHASEQLEKNLVRIASDQRKFIDFFLSEKISILEFILHSNQYDEMCQPGFIHTLFEKLQAESKGFVDLGVFNEKGIHMAYAGPYDLEGKPCSETEWFQSVKVYISWRILTSFSVLSASSL